MKARCRETDLSFGQIELAGQFRALPPHHVLAPLELHLQPVQLLGSEGGPGPLGPVQVQTFGQDNLPDGALSICSDQRAQSATLRHTFQENIPVHHC